MANFVMVVNQVTAEQLEKILGIQVRSKNTIRFMPQGVPHQPNGVGLASPAMTQSTGQYGTPPMPTVLYNTVRLEWSDEAVHFAREVFDLFTHHQKAEEKAG